MTLDEISHKAKQCSLKVCSNPNTILFLHPRILIIPDLTQAAQKVRYLSELFVRADNVQKKKIVALNKLTAMNKSLEEEVQRLKQIPVDAISKAKQLEKNWSESDLKRAKKEEELRNPMLDFSRIASERDDFQTRVAEWPHKKKIIYRKGVVQGWGNQLAYYRAERCRRRQRQLQQDLF
ncbi:hypothetical protein FNV43_RR00249 [Rhamnella rubrinervis]|uniref:Uncharacterized protein n=1 Tax=Rhamnella rubrinervis TaxID=2594499 RepID=A0A8K0HP72_9ROSA|nr:hypothetical protein FNV43_RR00249 [Rhamnella rubrinervis]